MNEWTKKIIGVGLRLWNIIFCGFILRDFIKFGLNKRSIIFYKQNL